jgi:drug/metabolite transporter (DMT)-like permease
MSHPGELAALSVAFIWTASALLFEVATNRIGVMAVNVIRLFMAFLMLCVLCYFQRGDAIPSDATQSEWIYLSLSGIIGFIFGDWCLLKSFELSGSRISMLFLAANPAIAALLGFLFISETLGLLSFIAMFVTFTGIVIAVFSRNKGGNAPVTIKGLLYGFGAALGQAVGIILSKKGMGGYNAFAATQIRVLAALIPFIFFLILNRKIVPVLKTFQFRNTIIILALASFLGTCLGVGLCLYAIQNANAGVASSIMSIVPVLIIIPSIIFLKQKTSIGEIIGAVVSVTGVILFFV